MDIQTTKLEIMHLLLQTQKENLLSKIKEIFNNEQADWRDEMSKSEQEEIEVGLLQVNKEEYVSHATINEPFWQMPLKFVWTPQAEKDWKGLKKVITYLAKEWTQKKIDNLKNTCKNFYTTLAKILKFTPQQKNTKIFIRDW